MIKRYHHHRKKLVNAYGKLYKKIRKFSYIETIVLLALYFGFGYFVDPNDICMINGEVSYILILLSVITLFHGFENGVLAISVIAFMMWYFYDTFAYDEFLVTLLMTMIFSEFHFYWNKKIKIAEVETDYKTTKLQELAHAFYSLKISHDQLEKNYVVKPMSIRNSIEYILQKNLHIESEDKQKQYYINFLELLEKSFHVNSGFIIYKDDIFSKDILTVKNAKMVTTQDNTDTDIDSILQDSLVDRAIDRQIPIFISDEEGNPDMSSNEDSDFIAAFPAVLHNNIIATLVIRRMPFMFFNRENLTSIALLLSYFSMEQRNANTLREYNFLPLVQDRDFQYEYYRLYNIYDNYQVESALMVLRLESELRTVRVYETISHVLRSLDKVVQLRNGGFYYIIVMFPLNDKSAALGFYNRLLNTLQDAIDKKFDKMIFSIYENDLLNKYLREDYAS
ncbi:Extracellular Matrix protein PelD [hydrothermal vent metagenome]|uniref:Extracellular Matrix protein PelD n=1 Tax=hydrothermal vent metagenome TaxID=652676 RepID=A0A1W1D3K0_9ZZZZ